MWINHPCSTLGACLEGRKELFTGLALEKLEKDWTEYPVLRLDLNAETYNTMEGLRSIVKLHLDQWEQRFPPDVVADTLSGRFSVIIRRAHEITGKQTCVLIDEYDKPLLSTLDNPELLAESEGLEKDACLEEIRRSTSPSEPSIFSDGNAHLPGGAVTLPLRTLTSGAGFIPLAIQIWRWSGGGLSFVLPCYSPVPADKSGFHIARFVDAFMERLKCFFEAIPYDLNDQTERHYHVVFNWSSSCWGSTSKAM